MWFLNYSYYATCWYFIIFSMLMPHPLDLGWRSAFEGLEESELTKRPTGEAFFETPLPQKFEPQSVLHLSILQIHLPWTNLATRLHGSFIADIYLFYLIMILDVLLLIYNNPLQYHSISNSPYSFFLFLLLNNVWQEARTSE